MVIINMDFFVLPLSDLLDPAKNTRETITEDVMDCYGLVEKVYQHGYYKHGGAILCKPLEEQMCVTKRLLAEAMTVFLDPDACLDFAVNQEMTMGYVIRDPEYTCPVIVITIRLPSPGLSGVDTHQFYIPEDQILNPEYWPQQYKGWHIPFRNTLSCRFDEL